MLRLDTKKSVQNTVTTRMLFGPFVGALGWHSRTLKLHKSTQLDYDHIIFMYFFQQTIQTANFKSKTFSCILRFYNMRMPLLIKIFCELTKLNVLFFQTNNII